MMMIELCLKVIINNKEGVDCWSPLLASQLSVKRWTRVLSEVVWLLCSR